MRQRIIAGQQPQQICDQRFHPGYAVAVQVSKGQTASGIRIDTDPGELMRGGGITLDPAVSATTSGGSFTFSAFQDRLYAVVDTGSTDIQIDVMRWRRTEPAAGFDMRKQPQYGSYEPHPDLGKGVPQAK